MGGSEDPSNGWSQLSWNTLSQASPLLPEVISSHESLWLYPTRNKTLPLRKKKRDMVPSCLTHLSNRNASQILSPIIILLVLDQECMCILNIMSPWHFSALKCFTGNRCTLKCLEGQVMAFGWGDLLEHQNSISAAKFKASRSIEICQSKTRRTASSKCQERFENKKEKGMGGSLECARCF